MFVRGRRLGFEGGGSPLPGSWMMGLVVGLAMSNLAAGAIMLGTSAAIGQAMIGKPAPVDRPQKH